LITPVTGGPSFTADKITGAYQEVFTLTSPTTFATTAFASLTTFTANEGTPPPVFVTNNLYALFTATGNVLGGGSTFQGTTGQVQLWRDNGPQTTFTLPASAPGSVTTANASTDTLLASTSSFLFGEGHNFPGALTAANGDFSLNFTNF